MMRATDVDIGVPSDVDGQIFFLSRSMHRLTIDRKLTPLASWLFEPDYLWQLHGPEAPLGVPGYEAQAQRLRQ
jgi:hypothetical protein